MGRHRQHHAGVGAPHLRGGHPRIEDHFDAVVYLGPQPTMAPLGYPRCADPDYVAMRVARMILAGMPPTVKERLAKDCDAARR